MAYTPIDYGFFADGQTLPAKLVQTVADNAQWIWDHKHAAWSMFWPAGVSDDSTPADYDGITGMVYTAAHGTDSLDYTGLYISSPAGEPISFNVPAPLTGRGNRVRVRMCVRFEDSITTAGSVFVWAMLTDGAGSVWPRPFAPSDLSLDYTGSPPVPALKSCTYPNAVEVTTSDNGADGWTVITIDVDMAEITRQDASPANSAEDRGGAGMPVLTVSFLSAYPDADTTPPVTVNTLTTSHFDQTSPVQIVVGPSHVSGIRQGPKPHQWMFAVELLEPGVLDSAGVMTLHTLCVREVDGNNSLSVFFWPPYELPVEPSTVVINTVNAPALRVFSLRIEETNQ